MCYFHSNKESFLCRYFLAKHCPSFISQQPPHLLLIMSSCKLCDMLTTDCSRQCAKLDSALLRTVGVLSEQRSNMISWTKNLCLRYFWCSKGTVLSASLSGSSNTAKTTSRVKTRCWIWESKIRRIPVRHDEEPKEPFPCIQICLASQASRARICDYSEGCTTLELREYL